MNLPLVAIDPGHGGYDPGAEHGPAQEKRFTLYIGLQLRDLLQKAGFGVVMTRTTDNSPGGYTEVNADLNERCRIANAAGANVFLSIHVNAGGGHGAEIYANGAGGPIAGLAKGIINNVSTVCGVHGQAVRDGGRNGSGWRVIVGTKMDAMLVEVGFIDTDDLTKIEANIDEFAPLIASAFYDFYGVAHPADHPVPAPVKPASTPFSADAVQQCEEWLGEYYQIAGADQRKASHWLADQYRVVRGAITLDAASKDTTFSADAAHAVILDLQTKYQADAVADHHAAAKWGADLMRKLKGIQ